MKASLIIRGFFTYFAKIVLAMVSVDVFVCSPFLSSFHFPPISLAVLVFRLKLSHCLVKTNLKEQQFWWEDKCSKPFKIVRTKSVHCCSFRRNTDLEIRIWRSWIYLEGLMPLKEPSLTTEIIDHDRYCCWCKWVCASLR